VFVMTSGRLVRPVAGAETAVISKSGRNSDTATGLVAVRPLLSAGSSTLAIGSTTADRKYFPR